MIDSYGVNAEYHVWVGIDPGITTGWAILGDDGKSFGTGTFVEENLYEGLDKLIRGLHRSKRTVTVVVERMPAGQTGPLARRLEKVRAVIDELVVAVYDLPVQYVLPGTWKTSRAARTAEHPDADTQHEIDASLLALYAIGREARRGRR